MGLLGGEKHEGYCMKCKKMKTIKGGKVAIAANGRRMHKGGKCPDCGTGMSAILPSEKKKK